MIVLVEGEFFSCPNSFSTPQINTEQLKTNNEKREGKLLNEKSCSRVESIVSSKIQCD